MGVTKIAQRARPREKWIETSAPVIVTEEPSQWVQHWLKRHKNAQPSQSQAGVFPHQEGMGVMKPVGTVVMHLVMRRTLAPKPSQSWPIKSTAATVTEDTALQGDHRHGGGQPKLVSSEDGQALRGVEHPGLDPIQ